MENRVLIVEDQALIRKGISVLVKSHYPTWQVYEAADGLEAIVRAREVRPEIILMDYRMPGLDGLKAAETIISEFPETKVIMVSAEEDSEFMFAALDANVSGIVAKTASDEELLHAIRMVKNGKRYFEGLTPEKISQYFYEKNKKRIPGKHHHSSLLTDRELEILVLIARGNSAADIAAKLFISKRTVEVHKANIMKKCQVGSTADLVRYAISKKLIDLPL
jgi:two-component system, NarL family, response regulator NreC